jgi:hypothetical protein
LPTEETFEEIAADEAIWDAQFAETDDDKLAALVAAVEAEMNECSNKRVQASPSPDGTGCFHPRERKGYWAIRSD